MKNIYVIPKYKPNVEKIQTERLPTIIFKFILSIKGIEKLYFLTLHRLLQPGHVSYMHQNMPISVASEGSVLKVEAQLIMLFKVIHYSIDCTRVIQRILRNIISCKYNWLVCKTMIYMNFIP